MNDDQELADRIDALVNRTRERLGREGVTRESLAAVRDDLIDLGRQTALFDPRRFPMSATSPARMYVLHAEPDEAMTLYINVCGAGVVSPPHDHATWAVIAGVFGEERNTFYEIESAAAGDGPRPIEVGGLSIVAGEAIALMPDDVHSIDTLRQPLVMTLHFYGRSLPSQTARRAFLQAGSATRYAPQPEIVTWNRP